jgi:predicted dehydrogenase
MDRAVPLTRPSGTLSHPMMKQPKTSRRRFLSLAAKTTLCTAPLLYSGRLFGAGSANGRLNIACVGLGGQMQGLMQEMVLFKDTNNIVALCDVSTEQIANRRKALGSALTGAREYRDYRVMLEREKSLDAVVIATPDHWHAAISAAAMNAGKHVYCEKPLTHTVGEARAIGQLAGKSKVVTQTGNQGSASANFRRSIELVQAGLLGKVHEVHIWHPPHGWPCAMDIPMNADPVPEGLDWDVWLGPAPARPYKQGLYHPGTWRGWYDFGGGSLADFCCHAFSLPVRALALEYPTRIEISGTPLAKASFPKECRVHFQFPVGGAHGPVTIHFHTGGEKERSVLPPPEVMDGMAETFNQMPTTGCLLVGEKGVISAGLWNNECLLRMQGEKEFQHATNHDAAKIVPITLPRAPKERHMLEWLEACRGNGKTFSPFEIGGHVTEVGTAGLIPLRLGHGIDWDGQGMLAKGLPRTDSWIKPQQRGECGLRT